MISTISKDNLNSIKKLILEKIQARIIGQKMLFRLLSNGNYGYQTEDYKLVINDMLKSGELIKSGEFIKCRDAE
jgi:hypothetical protein